MPSRNKARNIKQVRINGKFSLHLTKQQLKDNEYLTPTDAYKNKQKDEQILRVQKTLIRKYKQDGKVKTGKAYTATIYRIDKMTKWQIVQQSI